MYARASMPETIRLGFASVACNSLRRSKRRCWHIWSIIATSIRQFPSIAQLLQQLPATAAVLDGEIVAGYADGPPELRQAARGFDGPGTIRIWAFDLLALNGLDLRLQC